ncbi:unnamed protein product [Rotaria sp. Silwood2]|nr:unnamed protein product [Rotaria sp. Silwood2]CAF2856460.1 unnamed protein product [Rotaria sp. Silwood2]CAF3279355.1 unnamed protein product [Rotaria sp. Silwood2]CAF3362579.1 unnamed protein product [Rotaria sp. Silwood2]CAF3968472.1 unnamed protein product [Rotaria sp. Silwood2]
MSYYALFIALTLFTAVSHGKPTTFRGNQPKPCCVPNQFSALISSSTVGEIPNAETVATYGVFNISYDLNRDMVAAKGIAYSVIDQKNLSLWLIENIAEKQSYTIDLDTKECVKEPVLIQAFRCIPESATYLYSSMYGYDNNQFKGDTWYVEDKDLVSFVTVSGDGNCLLVGANTFVGNPRIVNSVTISNYVPKINDPSIFDIPDECKNAV